MYNYNCCKYCSNNPAVNPHASGVCCCTLPYLEMSRTVPDYKTTWTPTKTVKEYKFTIPKDMEEFIYPQVPGITPTVISEIGDVMKAYQVRYMKEYDDLCDRYQKLNKMIRKYDNGTLEFTLNCPIDILRKQSFIMWQYIQVLYDRAIYEKVDLEPICEGAYYD